VFTDSSLKNQVARNDPGITVPAFWTVSVQRPDHQFVDLKKQRALQQFTRLKTLDWGNFANNTLADAVTSFVSWTCLWGPPSEKPEKVSIQNTKLTPVQQYDGNPIIEDTAHIEWTMVEKKANSLLQSKLGIVRDFRFFSDEAKTSTSTYAHIGFESNGSLWVPAAASSDTN
jgi:hypothetical protein